MLSLFAAVVVALAIYRPWPVIPLVGGVAAAVAFVLRRQKRYWIELAAARRGDSLGTFARNFDCRSVDTWILRAVYEEVSGYIQAPVRADDHFHRDLKLHDEDVDELARIIAQRTGRPLENLKQNPKYRQVATVRDMVSFFVMQPKRRL